MTSFRVDRGRTGQARLDSEGKLIVRGVLTRTGVFTYHHKDGSVTRELRHPDDVFSADAVASFAQAPITDDHPPEGRVTPQNNRKYTVGNIGDSLAREGPKNDWVAADLIIRDDGTIKKIGGHEGQPRKSFLSCGYHADVVPEQGEFEGERYDHRQTNIRGNHVALVRNPRAGTTARLMLDSADAEVDGEDDWMDDASVHLDQRGFDAETKKKINKKIDHLVQNEGKSQEEAAGQAYAMAREGKLDAGGKPAGRRLPLIEDRDSNDNGDTVHQIGMTSTGKAVWSNPSHPDHEHFTAREQEEAARFAARRERLANGAAAYHEEQARYAEEEVRGEHQAQAQRATEEAKHYWQQYQYHLTKAANVRDDSADGEPPASEPKQAEPTRTREDTVTIKRVTNAVQVGGFKLDSVTIEINDEAEEALESLLEREGQLVEALEQAHNDAEQARGERDAMKGQIQDPTKLDELARERAEILDVAEHVGLKRDSLASIPNAEIKKQVVAKRSPDLINDSASGEYIQGCFNMIRADAAKASKSKNGLNRLGEATNPNRSDEEQRPDRGGAGERNDEPTPRQAAQERLASAHKTDEDASKAFSGYN